ncbi:MAG: TauD/TfdA family dioxygenase [Proteobacteria bacterium]|nr:TauD/TfdA family dioxygenase [Pseudomonadota bacterium]
MEPMKFERITVAPLAPALGAEVSGVDLSQPVDDTTADEIRRAFADYLVLFFRDQELTPESQVSFAGLFGPVGAYPFAEPIAEHPQVIPVIKEAHQTTNFGGIWHTDTPYLEQPSLGSVLYAREVPPYGGDTMWANGYRAWETLSEGLRATLEPLRAVQSAAKNKAELRADHLKDGAMRGHNIEEMDVRRAEHPVARTHPVTGRKALYVSPAHTTNFAGWTEAESAPLLDYLFSHITAEENTCRFRWTRGTVAVWDNRCSLHYPLNDYHGHRREMHRVTIEGEHPA